MPDLLTLNLSISETIALAGKHSFGGYDVSAGQLQSPNFCAEPLLEEVLQPGLSRGYLAIPPGKLPATDQDWEAALRFLPVLADRAASLGFQRAGLVILPFHESLRYEDAFEEHRSRINVLTNILDDFGIAVALEYVSPLTRRARYEYHFAHTMQSMLELCTALDSPRAGLLLDSFHWFCAGESREDIEKRSADQVVVVHINDAPPKPVEEQTVLDRAFPGDTQVIDMAGFIGGLRTIGYSGPVTCEPMSGAVEALGSRDPDFIAARTATSVNRILAATN